MVIESIPPSVEVAPLLQPVVDVIQPFLFKAGLVLGGIFGVYLLLILIRIHYERKHTKVLQNILYDLDNLNLHYGIPHSRMRKSFFQKIWHYLHHGKWEKDFCLPPSKKEKT